MCKFFSGPKIYFSLSQRHNEAREACVQSPGSGHGLQLLPSSVQLPDPSGRSLPAVQSVPQPDHLALGAGLDRSTHLAPGV